MRMGLDRIRLRPGAGFLLLGLLTTVLLRIPHYQHSLTFVDEGIYGSIAAELLRGSVLYRDVWCNHTPFVIYFCKWMFQIFGVGSLAVHAGSLLLALLECCLLYLIGTRFFNDRIGGLAAAAFAVISTTFYTPRIIGYTPEQLMIVCITSAVYLFLLARETGRAGGFFWAGVLSIAAVSSKPAAAPELLMFPAFVIFGGFLRRKQALAWFSLGSLAAAAALVGTLSASGSLGPFWNQSIASRIYYVNQVGWAAFARLIARQPASFGLIFLWLWILLWAGRRSLEPGDGRVRFLALWLAAALAGVLVGRRFYANYYIQVFPVLSLLSAVSLDQVLREGLWQRHRKAAVLGITALSISFLWFQSRAFAHWYFFLDRDAHRNVKLWDMCVLDRNTEEAARQIRSATRAGDRIFVWGPSPEFYFLSGRAMATAYPFFDVMDNSQPPYGDEEQRTLNRLLESPPALIVDSFKSASMADRAGWADLLARHYTLLRYQNGVRLYLRKM